MDFIVTVPNAADLTEKFKQAPSIAAPILQRAINTSSAILAKNTVKGVVPWLTGFLTQTFKADIQNLTLRWFPTASYAPFVEFGTRPHVILPKEKQALFWPGAAHPVRSVNHPGTRANPFMERIISYSQAEIENTFMIAAQQITKAIAS